MAREAGPREPGNSASGGEAGGGEPRGEEPGGDTPLRCELCGGPVLDRHCKVTCLNCGFQRDCSDP